MSAGWQFAWKASCSGGCGGTWPTACGGWKPHPLALGGQVLGAPVGLGHLGESAAGSSMWLARWLGSGASGTCTLRVGVRAVLSPHCVPGGGLVRAPCSRGGQRTLSTHPSPGLACCPPALPPRHLARPFLGQAVEGASSWTPCSVGLSCARCSGQPPVAPVSTRTRPGSGQRLGLQGAGAGAGTPTVTVKSGPTTVPRPPPALADSRPAWNRPWLAQPWSRAPQGPVAA